jgi:hypothetical protein
VVGRRGKMRMARNMEGEHVGELEEDFRKKQ